MKNLDSFVNDLKQLHIELSDETIQQFVDFYDWLIENKEVMGDGPGLWCSLHICLMVMLAAWLVACWFVCKKHKKFALKMTTTLCWLMLFFRLFIMALLYF